MGLPRDQAQRGVEPEGQVTALTTVDLQAGEGDKPGTSRQHIHRPPSGTEAPGSDLASGWSEHFWRR